MPRSERMDVMKTVSGLHHVTAIAGPAQENLDFYAGVLGMALVKKSVNQDDPGTYHLFYADAEGHPGTDLTFFPWAEAAPARPGHGLDVALVESEPAAGRTFTPAESSPVAGEHQIRGLHGARSREQNLAPTTA